MRILSVFSVLAGVSALQPAHWKRGPEKVLIGYRNVNDEQAQQYTKAGSLVYEENKAGEQLGKGVYTTPDAGWWTRSGDYHCSILADREALDKLNKAWIPRPYWADGKAIDEYIKSLDNTWDPAKTLRLGLFAGYPGKLNMVIPPDLVPSDPLKPGPGQLGTQVTCNKDAKEVERGVVDYNTWTNIKGIKITEQELKVEEEAAKIAKALETAEDLTEDIADATGERLRDIKAQLQGLAEQAGRALSAVVEIVDEADWLFPLFKEPFDAAKRIEQMNAAVPIVGIEKEMQAQRQRVKDISSRVKGTPKSDHEADLDEAKKALAALQEAVASLRAEVKTQNQLVDDLAKVRDGQPVEKLPKFVWVKNRETEAQAVLRERTGVIEALAGLRQALRFWEKQELVDAAAEVDEIEATVKELKDEQQKAKDQQEESDRKYTTAGHELEKLATDSDGSAGGAFVNKVLGGLFGAGLGAAVGARVLTSEAARAAFGKLAQTAASSISGTSLGGGSAVSEAELLLSADEAVSLSSQRAGSQIGRVIQKALGDTHIPDPILQGAKKLAGDVVKKAVKEGVKKASQKVALLS